MADMDVNKMKSVMRLMLILIVVLFLLLVFNYIKLQEYKSISSGTYYTEQECNAMYADPMFTNLSQSIIVKEAINVGNS